MHPPYCSYSTCTASLFIKKVQTETNYLGLSIVFTGGTTDVAYVSFDSVNGISRNMDSRITAILNVVDYGTYWRYWYIVLSYNCTRCTP